MDIPPALTRKCGKGGEMILRWEDPGTREKYAVRVPRGVGLPKNPAVSMGPGEGRPEAGQAAFFPAPNAIRAAPLGESKRLRRPKMGFLVTRGGKIFICEQKNGGPGRLIAEVLPGFLKGMQKR
jgi:hypothetical protein